jgi:predicted metal-dependent enzyme (double-stranded beta helix superfamily)
MPDIDRFIEDCRDAAQEGVGHKAVREVVSRAVADRPSIVSMLGEPAEAGISKIYQGPELTILHVVWAPQMTVMPHNHEMWAVIGVYTGAEDNIFWRRNGQGVEAAGATALRERDAVPLGPDIIHSVTNPTDKMTGAIHVYGGDFFSAPRSEWDPETLRETAYDVEKTMRLFAEANARCAAGRQLAH